MAVLRRRLYFALGVRCELVEAGDGARRLLVGRFELLALGGVLVELVTDVRTDTNDNGGGKVREYRCPARHRIVPYTSIRKSLSSAGKRAGLGHVRPHDLRHTFLSRPS